MGRRGRPVTINLAGMSAEERKAYQRQKSQEHRVRQGWSPIPKEKPKQWACKQCGIIKPFTSEFYMPRENSQWGLMRRCRECRTDQHRTTRVKREYGLTAEQYLIKTTGECAICKTPGKLHMDHDHKTGIIRAGLCNNCNSGLGFFKDDPVRMRAAANYIEEHNLLD